MPIAATAVSGDGELLGLRLALLAQAKPPASVRAIGWLHGFNFIDASHDGDA